MDEDFKANPSSPKKIKLEVEDSGLLIAGYGHSIPLFPARGNIAGITGSAHGVDAASSVEMRRATVDARGIKVETDAEKENVVPSAEGNNQGSPANFDMSVGSTPDVKREAGEEFSDQNVNVVENAVVHELPNVQYHFVDVLQSPSGIQKGTENATLGVKAEIQEEFPAQNVSTAENATVPEAPVSGISLNNFLQSVIDIRKGVENTHLEVGMETQEKLSAHGVSTVEKEVVPELPNARVSCSEKSWNDATQFSSDIDIGSLTEQMKNNNNHVDTARLIPNANAIHHSDVMDNTSDTENSHLSALYLHQIQTIDGSPSPTPSEEEILLNITDLASDVDPRENLLEQADESVPCNKSSAIREDDVVFVPEILNDYEVIDLTEDFLSASPASTLPTSDHLDPVMDVTDDTLPTSLLNFLSLNFDIDIICQLSLENPFLEDKKPQIGKVDVIDSSFLPKPLPKPKPLPSSLKNVKTEEQDIIEEDLYLESGTASFQNTKTNVSPSMQGSLTSAADCSGAAVNATSSQDIPKDSQFHSAPKTEPILKDEVAEDVELVFASSGVNYKNGVPKRKRPSNFKQRSVVPPKKPKRLEVQVGKSGTIKVPRKPPTPKLESASSESNVEQNTAGNPSQPTSVSQAISSPASSELSDATSSKTSNITESRLREGISPLDPRRKAVPLPTKKPQVSSPRAVNDSCPDVLGLQPMAYHSGHVTGPHGMYPSPYSFQSGPAPYFAGPMATMNYSHYFSVQCPDAFAETVVHHPQPLPYPMMYPSPNAQSGDMSHMIQYPMVHSFTHAQMDVSSYAYGPMPYPMADPAQMPVPQAMEESSVPENINK